MVVFILERVTASLRGELTRWLLEPKSGVFIGRVNADIRTRLWEKVRGRRGKKGAGLMIWSSNTEQGFRMDGYGDTSRELVDYEGLVLVRKPKKEEK